MLNIFALPGFMKVHCLSPQGVVLFNKMGEISLLCQIPCRGNSGKTAADNQSGLIHYYLRIGKWLQQAHFGYCHAYKVYGLFSGCVFFIAVYPGTLIANISHFKEIFINPRIEYGFLKERFMGTRGAGGYNNAI